MTWRWSKERIIVALRAWRKRDPQLLHVYRYDSTLYYAAYRLFGNWNDAIEAAGVPPRRRRWTKQDIVAAIRARLQRNLPMWGITGKAPALYSAAHRHFGGWPQAMKAAGLFVKPKRFWTRDGVVAAIRARHAQRLPLSGMQRVDRALWYGAIKHFGKWEKAVRAAGIPDGWQHTWSRDRLIAELQAYGSPQRPPTSRDIPAAIRQAVFQYFGSWYAAFSAAGWTVTSPPVAQKTWTKEAILRHIRLRHRQGIAMTISANGSLARAAARCFGTWSGALRAAHVPIQNRRMWTPERVLDAIRDWHRRGAFVDGDRIDDTGLMLAGNRRFGGWHRALVAAGVRSPDDRDARRWKWPRRRIIEAIQDRYVRGRSLVADHDKSLAGAAIRVFGSWHAALLAAGVPAGEKPRPRIQWTRDAVIRAILTRRDHGLSLTNVGASDSALACAAKRQFGSWRAALTAAGIATTGAAQ